MQQHRLKAMAQKVVQYNKELVDFNLDADGILQDELQRMRSNPLDSFYHQLSSTLEYYEKFPGLQSMDQPDLRQLIDEEMEVANNKNAISFSGEEIFGKYLDLNPLFLQYVNVTKSLHSSGSGSSGNSIEQDYLQYLDKFNVFFYLPDSFKQTTSTAKPYLEYLKTLWQYLVGFYKRVHPLIEIENVIQDWEKEFEEKVKKGEIKLLKDAQKSNSNAGGVTREPQPLRLGMFNDPKELEALGLDRLKEALEALGLKCGGTLQDRAQRLWSVRGKKLEEIPASLKVKPTKKTGSAAVTTSSSTEGSRENSGNEKSLVEKVS
jgi:splicing factor 3A subunit 3